VPGHADWADVVQDTALSHAEQLFAQGDTNGDGVLNCEEVIALMLKVSFPPSIPCHSHLLFINLLQACILSRHKGSNLPFDLSHDSCNSL